VELSKVLVVFGLIVTVLWLVPVMIAVDVMVLFGIMYGRSEGEDVGLWVRFVVIAGPMQPVVPVLTHARIPDMVNAVELKPVVPFAGVL